MQREVEDKPNNNHARIQRQGEGMGPVTEDAIEHRAREIAQIEGRQPDDVTEADRDRAWRELNDQDLTLSTDDAHADIVASSDPAHLVVDTGHKIANMQPMDEQQIMEKEVKEGVREAEHERMLEAQENRDE